MQYNIVYTIQYNTVYTIQYNTVYTMQHNTVYTLQYNIVYIIQYNIVYNAVYTIQYNVVYTIQCTQGNAIGTTEYTEYIEYNVVVQKSLIHAVSFRTCVSHTYFFHRARVSHTYFFHRPCVSHTYFFSRTCVSHTYFFSRPQKNTSHPCHSSQHNSQPTVKNTGNWDFPKHWLEILPPGWQTIHLQTATQEAQCPQAPQEDYRHHCPQDDGPWDFHVQAALWCRELGQRESNISSWRQPGLWLGTKLPDGIPPHYSRKWNGKVFHKLPN